MWTPNSRCKGSVQITPHPQRNCSVKNTIPRECKRGAVYKKQDVALMKHVESKNINAVKIGDMNNEVAAHAWELNMQ